MSPPFVAVAEPEAKKQTEVPSAPPMSPAEELLLLERSALEKGMSPEKLGQIRQIGVCPTQIQARIRHLHEWLAAN